MTENEIKKIVAETVEQTLLTLGMDMDDPITLQKDMQFLRGLRESAGTVKKQGLTAAVGIITVGLLGYLWMAVKGGQP